MINLDSISKSVNRFDGSFTIDAIYTEVSNPSTQVSAVTKTGDWFTCNIVSTGYSSGAQIYYVTYNVTYGANTGAERDGELLFRQLDVYGYENRKTFYLTQSLGTFIYAPIYKYTDYYLSGETSMAYSICKDDTAVFFGKGNTSPEDGGVYINVNRVCDSYLSNELPDFRNMDNNVVTTNAYGTFCLKDEDGLARANYGFLQTYEGDWSGQTKYDMTIPINGHLDPRMRMMCTIYNNSNTAINYSIYD